MIEQFRARRDLVVSHFREKLPGVEFVEPTGAFYFFFRVDSFFAGAIKGAMEFCQQLLGSHGVALVPGEAFGDKRWVRLSYAASTKELTAALARISEFAETLHP